MYQKNKNCACKIQKSIVYYTSQRNWYSSIAQSVEQTAVNRWVVGSSPTRGVFSKLARPHGQAVKTSPFHGGNRGPNPLGVIFKKYADVAQLAEQLICNQQVIGSSPIIGFTWEIKYKNRISRDGAVWKLVGLITRRS